MSKLDPAYPSWQCHEEFNDGTGRYEPVWHTEGGLTKLEAYAKAALESGIFNDDFYKWANIQRIAQMSFDMAEAMVAESEKRK